MKLVEGAKFKQPPLYQVSSEENEVLREYFHTSLESGLIKPSDAPFSSPVIFVRKEDGTKRLCVDFRNVNQVTVRNCYSMPLISKITGRIRKSKWFSKIDLVSAFTKIRINSLVVKRRHFNSVWNISIKSMLFGLKNALLTFQRYINSVF
jgi:hypothetical protein